MHPRRVFSLVAAAAGVFWLSTLLLFSLVEWRDTTGGARVRLPGDDVQYDEPLRTFVVWAARCGADMSLVRLLAFPLPPEHDGDASVHGQGRTGGGDVDGAAVGDSKAREDERRSRGGEQWVDAAAAAARAKSSLSRGAVTNVALAPRTALMSVPMSMVITVGLVEGTFYGVQMMGAAYDFAPSHYLAAFILHGLQDRNNFFTPYFDVLPSIESPWIGQFPQFWTQNELRRLTGSTLLDRIKAEKRQLAQTLRRLREIAPEWCPTCSSSDWLWANTIVRSRMLSLGVEADRQTHALVPLIDMVPHGARPTVRRSFSWTTPQDSASSQFNDPDLLILVAIQSFSRNHPLRLAYSSGMPNPATLLTYGVTVGPPRGLTAPMTPLGRTGRTVRTLGRTLPPVYSNSDNTNTSGSGIGVKDGGGGTADARSDGASRQEPTNPSRLLREGALAAGVAGPGLDMDLVVTLHLVR